jgi:hypothetical protein
LGSVTALVDSNGADDDNVGLISQFVFTYSSWGCLVDFSHSKRSAESGGGDAWAANETMSAQS